MRRERKKISNNKALDNILNMTPFVDLLFTLLIVFMIPNELIFGSVKVEIPKGQVDIVPVKTKPIVVSITKDGSIFIEDIEVNLTELPKEMMEITMRDFSQKIFILGDKDNSYGRIVSILDTLNSSGFNDVVLITDADSDLILEKNINNIND